ncbi:MAG: hypothetical protein M9894_27405 [Planctomycetes bacterium]|nr:hypothetical protein [Planctomycetota bacterium]MCW8138453.1 hypothetical protein [Planctomycetota bacterium]
MSTNRPSGKPSLEAEQKLARLLSYHWEILNEADREAALLAAYTFGAELAEDVHEEGEEDACGDAEDYQRVCVKFASDAGVCNDVEVALWESQPCDPRHGAFREGFVDRRRELTA